MIRKNYLLMFVLTLLVFAGQASAQSFSLRHPKLLLMLTLTGTEGIVSGQGTEIVVEVSQTGITQSVNAIQITFDFDLSLVTALLHLLAGYKQVLIQLPCYLLMQHLCLQV